MMSLVPGAAVGVTNGEGHTTAIRQPFTTSPVYLFLEDGIPIRSTGFFNHNALYEINIPQAGGVEVVRGPGTALYGSEAIGGVVNVLTRAPPSEFARTSSTGGVPPSRLNGQVAQLVEQRTENPRVGGSIPPLATIVADLVTRGSSELDGAHYALDRFG